jgi:hypothetical protein
MFCLQYAATGQAFARKCGIKNQSTWQEHLTDWFASDLYEAK